MKRLLAITTAAVICALAALAAFSGSARATYPGATNGRIAFGMNVNGNTDVYTALPGGQDLRRLTTHPGFDACAAYSPDGRRIAYCSGQGGDPVQVWTMKQNGTDKQQVTHMSVTAIFPDFSPNGSKIVFCAGGSTFARDIYVANSDGSDLSRLTSGVGNNVYPAFSPDGSKIVFTSNRTGTSQVWLMNADGSNQRQLTFDSQPKDQVPDWSPNGSKIAYLADTHGIADMGNSWGDIWVMNADGSGQHPITSGATYYGTAWSPDGSRIATLDFPSRTVYTVNASDGNDPRQSTPARASSSSPAGSPAAPTRKKSTASRPRGTDHVRAADDHRRGRSARLLPLRHPSVGHGPHPAHVGLAGKEHSRLGQCSGMTPDGAMAGVSRVERLVFAALDRFDHLADRSLRPSSRDAPRVDPREDPERDHAHERRSGPRRWVVAVGGSMPEYDESV